MDFSAIGQRIRELRKSIGLSQEELARDICTQAQISKIEKGDVYPYANTLYLISQKLGVDVNYFFEIGSTPRLDYVSEVARQLMLARRNFKYQEMERIVKAEQHNPLFIQNTRNRQLILWHKGIYEHVLYGNVEKALELLNEAIDTTHKLDKVWSEKEIEILLTIGVVYFEEENYNEALITYLKAKKYLVQLPFHNDNTLLPRLYYSIARVYTRMLNYNESIVYCKQAIKWCLEKDNLFTLGELHYQISYNYEMLHNYPSAKTYLERAITIFELQQDEKYLVFIKDKLDDLKNSNKS